MAKHPHPLETTLVRAWPPERWSDVHVLLGVSGGADSVALLRAVVAVRPEESRFAVHAAHFNHALRGEESDADEAFVVQMCRNLGIECHVGRAEGPSGPPADCLRREAAARRARYAFLRQTATQLGARYVATAHTADDQAETILHRILRGTGIAGLAGIPRTRQLSEAVTLVRPLLTVRRAELVAYLDAIGQPYRVDSSNADLRLTRNRLRHRLLPQLARHYNPKVSEALVRLGGLAGEVQQLVGGLVDAILETGSSGDASDTVRLATGPLAGQSRYLVRETLITLWRRQGWPMQSMGHAEWDVLASMALDAAPQKRILPGNVTVQRQPDHLMFRRAASDK